MRSACSAIGPIRLKSVVAVVVFVAALDFDGDVEMVVANCWCVIVVVQPTEFHDYLKTSRRTRANQCSWCSN